MLHFTLSSNNSIHDVSNSFAKTLHGGDVSLSSPDFQQVLLLALWSAG